MTKWNIIQAYAPQHHQLPVKAMGILTPLVPSSWRAALNGYLHQPIVDFVMFGISHGFQVGFDYRQDGLKSAYKNLSCTMEHKEVVDEYLTNELCH